jgi:hypothetical protein
MARMRQFGSVEIPQEAFLKALKMGMTSRFALAKRGASGALAD